MAEILEFDSYAPDRFVRLTVALAARGLKIMGDSGELKEMGADVSYRYSGTTLTLTVNKAPFLHTESGFCEELRTFIETQQ